MLGQGYGLDPSLVRQPMSNALRNNMFGMEEQGRGGGYQQMPKPEMSEEGGMGVLGEGEGAKMSGMSISPGIHT